MQLGSAASFVFDLRELGEGPEGPEGREPWSLSGPVLLGPRQDRPLPA